MESERVERIWGLLGDRLIEQLVVVGDFLLTNRYGETVLFRVGKIYVSKEGKVRIEPVEWVFFGTRSQVCHEESTENHTTYDLIELKKCGLPPSSVLNSIAALYQEKEVERFLMVQMKWLTDNGVQHAKCLTCTRRSNTKVYVAPYTTLFEELESVTLWLLRTEGVIAGELSRDGTFAWKNYIPQKEDQREQLWFMRPSTKEEKESVREYYGE